MRRTTPLVNRMPILSALTLALITLTIVSATLTAAETPRQIEVSGHGKVSAAPDMAMINFTFSERSRQSNQAKKLVDTQVTNLLKLAKKFNIKDTDIQAARLNIYPEYDYKRDRQLVGYRVSRDVKIKLRDLDQYADLLDAAVGVGATHSGQLVLDFSDRETLEREAMLAAYSNARNKAKALARKAGGRLGEVIWISESGGYRPPQPMQMGLRAMESDSAAAYPTGEQELQMTVHVRFELLTK